MNAVVETRGLCKQYGPALRVNHLDLTVPEGAVYGFLGPNGAGKSTTLKLLLGLARPTAGEIAVFGRPMGPRTRMETLSQVGSLIESPSYYGHLTGAENLHIVQTLRGAPERDIGEVLRIVRLDGQKGKRTAHYSLGMKQRLGLAAALLGFPRLLILDEPTNGLDPAGIKEFRDLLRGLAHTQGLAVLVSSHILQEMQLMCDRVGIISKGCLKQVATMEELTHAGRGGVYRYTARPMETFRQLLEANAADRIVAAAADYMDVRIAEDEIPGFNRRLMENQVDIYGLSPVGSTLEDTFIEITGGGNVIG